jgi:hypothetical protein
MSRPGSPWENGKCESLIKTLKKEEIDARPYSSFEELQEHLREFIEEFIIRAPALRSELLLAGGIRAELGAPSGTPAGGHEFFKA